MKDLCDHLQLSYRKTWYLRKERVWVTRELMEFLTYHPNGRSREDLRLLASDGEVQFKRESGGTAESASLLSLESISGN